MVSYVPLDIINICISIEEHNDYPIGASK